MLPCIASFNSHSSHARHASSALLRDVLGLRQLLDDRAGLPHIFLRSWAFLFAALLLPLSVDLGNQRYRRVVLRLEPVMLATLINHGPEGGKISRT